MEALRSNTYAAGNVLLELVEKPDLKVLLYPILPCPVLSCPVLSFPSISYLLFSSLLQGFLSKVEDGDSDELSDGAIAGVLSCRVLTCHVLS